MCSYANFMASSLVQFLYMPNARVSVCTVRQPAYGEESPQCGFGLYLGFGYCKGLCEGAFFSIFCGKSCRIGQDHAEPGEKQDRRGDGKWWKGYSRGRSW